MQEITHSVVALSEAKNADEDIDELDNKSASDYPLSDHQETDFEDDNDSYSSITQEMPRD